MTDLEVLKKILHKDDRGDLWQDMFEAVNLIDPTEEVGWATAKPLCRPENDG